ncbi:hypothetical protein [Mycobacterium sp. E342]|uniref:hypothetical protein n=1 Tax=Mycobacterium sp. E342 TaxID=1834147 RepID=UPI000AED499E|nr:hypothetical protein [Mycobacterium sp. E342]
MTGKQLSSEADAFAASSRTDLTALPDPLHGRHARARSANAARSTSICCRIYDAY